MFKQLRLLRDRLRGPYQSTRHMLRAAKAFRTLRKNILRCYEPTLTQRLVSYPPRSLAQKQRALHWVQSAEGAAVISDFGGHVVTAAVYLGASSRQLATIADNVKVFKRSLLESLSSEKPDATEQRILDLIEAGEAGFRAIVIEFVQ